MECLEQTELGALGNGMDGVAVRIDIDLGSEGFQAAHCSIDVRTGGIADHMRGARGQSCGNDEPVRHRFRGDSGNGSG